MDEKRNVIAKEAMKALTEIEDTVRMEELIKDNKIEFVVEDKTYRVRKPIFIETQEVDSVRRKKYLEYVKDETYLFRKQWIEQYKSKGIDILSMEKKVRDLQADINNYLLMLAKSVEPREIDQLKKDILRLRDEQLTVSMEVTDLLSHSIENQMLIFVNSYITYLVLEKKENDIWIKVYDIYDNFMKAEDKVITQAFYYINYLIYQFIGENK